MRAAALALLFSVAATTPAAADPVRAMKPEARTHFDAGLEAYADKDYQRAADELAAGHVIDPHPDFLFPWAQAERLSGDCAAAVPLYRKVLDAGVVDADERRDVERLLEQCEAEEPPPAAEPDAPAPAQPPARRDFVAASSTEIEATAPATSSSRAWYRDGWGAALTAGGVVGLAVGAGFLWSASRAEEDSGDAGDLGTFIDDTDRASRNYTLGAISVGVGAGLLAGGIIRYALSGTF
ncbi:MAG TPA: hypothetical protein VMZ28_19960 [Kofleriaceae bacterium]|nr:hypothetical protein [Kofleriaceae bacterium]